MRERYKEPTGLDSGIDDGVAEVSIGPIEPLQTEEKDNLPSGYARSYKPEGYAEADVAQGYYAYGSLDLDEMFGAFEQPNRGVVGGGRTVDDFTPLGLDDSIEGSTEDMEGDDDDDKRPARRGTISQRYP